MQYTRVFIKATDVVYRVLDMIDVLGPCIHIQTVFCGTHHGHLQNRECFKKR